VSEISFGRWLSARRHLLDLTQDELARRVGCSVVTIRKLEADERRPSKQIAERLAACLAIAHAQRRAFLALARGEGRAESLALLLPIALRPPRALRLPARSWLRR
jgi:transcriptional regulator with XRE-family HTH domain